MTTNHLPHPAATLAGDAAHREEEVPSWNTPFNNPFRSALLASASAQLAESARRIEELQARLATLTSQPAAA